MVDQGGSPGSTAPQVESGDPQLHDAVVGRIFVVLALTVASWGAYAVAFRSPTFFAQISDEYLLQAASCGAVVTHARALSGPTIPPVQPQVNGCLLVTTLFTYLIGTLCFSMVAGLLTVRSLCNAKLGSAVIIGVTLLIPGLYSAGFVYAGYTVSAIIAICVTVLSALWLYMFRNYYFHTPILTAETSNSLPKYMTLTIIPVGCVLAWSAFSLLMAAMIFAAVMNGHVVPDRTAHVQLDGTCLNADGGKVVHCCMWQVRIWVRPYLGISCLIWLWGTALVSDIKIYMIGFTIARWYLSHSSPPANVEAVLLGPELAHLPPPPPPPTPPPPSPTPAAPAAEASVLLLDMAHDGEAASSDALSSSDVWLAARQAVTTSFSSLCVSAALPNSLLRWGVKSWEAYFGALALIAVAAYVVGRESTIALAVFLLYGGLTPNPGHFTLTHLATEGTNFGLSLVAVLGLETVHKLNVECSGRTPMLMMYCLLLAVSWGLAMGLLAANIGYDIFGDRSLTGIIIGELCGIVGCYMLGSILFLPADVMGALHYCYMRDVKEQRCSRPKVHRLLDLLQQPPTRSGQEQGLTTADASTQVEGHLYEAPAETEVANMREIAPLLQPAAVTRHESVTNIKVQGS